MEKPFSLKKGRPRGVGVGLRSPHFEQILRETPPIPWFEAVSENFMGLGSKLGGRPFEMLQRIRCDYPIVLHGVSLSIGSSDPLDKSYLGRLRELIQAIQPAWVSDHLCWTGVAGNQIHDLLPLPYTEKVIEHVAERLDQVQNYLGRTLLLENVSSYLAFRHSAMTEWEFLSEIAQRSGCEILLDVNNIYVSAINHDFAPEHYLEGVPVDKVRQFHLAGFSDMGTHLVDTHDHPVWEPVWKLYRQALERFGEIPTLIEWDDNIPSLERLREEARLAEDIFEQVHGKPYFSRTDSNLARLGH